MDKKQAIRLGNYLRQAREKQGLSTHKLSDRAGINQASIVRIERGEFGNPDPDKLTAIAAALDLDPAEVLTRAGYPVPAELLEPTTYLRTKFRDLPHDQLASLQSEVAAVLRRHGINSGHAPTAGEDEEPGPTTTNPKGGTP